MRFPTPRLLPIAITLVLLSIGMKMVDVISVAISGAVFTTVTPAVAETAASPAAAPAVVATNGAPAAAATGDKTADDKATGTDKSEAASNYASLHQVSASTDVKQETDLLTSLNQKRTELETRSQALDQREALLKAAEDRINKKVDELGTMRTDLEKLLDVQKGKDEAQIASLVKIYETMKAKDAARIFDTLDPAVMVEVAARIKEQKMAPILAAMSPERARLLTVKLSDRRKALEGGVIPAKAPATESPAASPASQKSP